MNPIKEAFDSLPIAACFFDSNGIVCLVNHKMLFQVQSSKIH